MGAAGDTMTPGAGTCQQCSMAMPIYLPFQSAITPTIPNCILGTMVSPPLHYFQPHFIYEGQLEMLTFAQIHILSHIWGAGWLPGGALPFLFTRLSYWLFL